MLAKHNFRLAYENWAWATHAPNWKDVWTIVQKVNCPNIGLSLDTFETASREWANPTIASSLQGSKAKIKAKFKASLEELARGSAYSV